MTGRDGAHGRIGLPQVLLFLLAFSLCMIAGAGEAPPRPPLEPSQPVIKGAEDYLFTPAGFTSPGKPITASGAGNGRLKIVVRDKKTGLPTACRLNVVGPDGNYYQPAPNDLTPYALTGQWPRTGLGNREGKAPYRYYGRFFYSRGETVVNVPPGSVRIEAWKGFEYHPEQRTVTVRAGAEQAIEIALTATLPLAERGYYAGDAHLHFARQTEADDQRISDLLAAEDIRFGSILAYNDPPGPYAGFMDKLQSPQRHGLGLPSLRRQGDVQILSGQEYRTTTYGHLNLYLRDRLVAPGSTYSANDWPLYGDVGRETQQQGGLAFYAHGGYAQAIYADFALGNVNAVELLQFGVYRGIGLDDWYRILNSGYRFPCLGSSDYPACRILGDCRTYVQLDPQQGIVDWLRSAAAGRSFVTTGPLLLLEVDGQAPGASIEKTGKGPHTVTARLQVASEVAPVTNLELLVNGKSVRTWTLPATGAKGQWQTLEEPLHLSASAWIAARAFSRGPAGLPDGEAHTNPVYVYLDGKAPYDAAALAVLIQRVEQQLAAHGRRSFAEKARVLDYFQAARNRLRALGAQGGLAAPEARAIQTSAATTTTADGLDPSRRTHRDDELQRYLKPLPPKPPAAAIKTIETTGGFRMELVASEPLVHSPVAAAFDENGDLYVAEMRDYPYRPRPGNLPLGAIRLLHDSKGNGTLDQSYVFADHLLWAAGIAPWKGGIFVAAPPDIWYLKDTDGDHRADVRVKVYTGFGTQNEQGMLNNLLWGLDHRIYGSGSVNGGLVRPADKPDAPGIDIRHRDFRFDPVSGAFETITGTMQFGNTFDDWGNRFLCNESHPLLHAVLPQHYLARNPYLPVPAAITNLCENPVPIFRSSPIERWREIRSSRRIAHGERPATSAGASHHVVDAGAGVTVYRGGAYPKEFYGNVFVGDAQNNLIHRRRLIPAGPTFTSQRVEEGTEFVRSSDNWFRPVNFVNAPDGTLYALDMSREILEAIHIPLDVLKFIDLRRGRNQGRLYRIAPPGFTYPGAPPRLGEKTTVDLVALLESPHGYYRDTAHRLLYERQDPAAVVPLRRLLTSGKTPQARLHSLWSLQGLGALAPADLLAALADPHFALRQHALQLAEPRLNTSASLLGAALALVRDSDPRVRYQLAFTLGEVNDGRAARALAELARIDAANQWTRTAILSSVTAAADRVLVEVLAEPAFSAKPEGMTFAQQLALVVGVRNRPHEVARVLTALAGAPGSTLPPTVQRQIVLSLGSGLKRAQARLSPAASDPSPSAAFIRRLLAQADHTAAAAAAPEPERVEAIQLLGCAPFATTRSPLAALLDPRQPQTVQLAVLSALADYTDPAVAAIVLEPWRQYAPAVRLAALQVLLAREPWTIAYFDAARAGSAAVTQVEPARRELLLKHPNPTIVRQARELFGSAAASPRKQVVEAYLGVLKRPADPARGKAVFQRICANCHKVKGEGTEVGPDLTTTANRDPSALLLNILDPNYYVLPSYIQYLAIDKSGRSLTGIIAAETATSITLRREKGAEDVLLRSDLETLVSTGKSLMPEELEKQITPQEMADLIRWLTGVQASTAAPPRLDIGTLPGMLEPEEKP